MLPYVLTNREIFSATRQVVPIHRYRLEGSFTVRAGFSLEISYPVDQSLSTISCNLALRKSKESRSSEALLFETLEGSTILPARIYLGSPLWGHVGILHEPPGNAYPAN